MVRHIQSTFLCLNKKLMIHVVEFRLFFLFFLTGALDTLILDMTKLVWSVVTTVNPRDPLASEV